MSKFIVSTKINYPVGEVFNSFVNISKKDFKKFNLDNPIGSKYKRMVKKNKYETIYMENEITDYKLGSIYEVTGRVSNSEYVSKFEFKAINDNITEIKLTESQKLNGIFNKLTFLFQLVTVKRKLQKKINNINKVLDENILKNRRKSDK